MVKHKKYLLSVLKEGMVCTHPLLNKKMQVILPQNLPINQSYLAEWYADKIEYVFTTGEFLSDDSQYRETLPGYLSLETRQILQYYYNHVEILKTTFSDERHMDLSKLQQIASNWVSFIMKFSNPQELFKVIRYSIFDEKDYFVVHTMDVMILSLGIYTKYNIQYTSFHLMQLAMGALLFDIGMLLLPKELQNSKNEYSDTDKQELKTHPLLGYHFLINEMKVPKIFSAPALEHHERPDGSGYPQKLKAHQLHSNSMIIAIADLFTSQIRSRSFKQSKEPVEILKNFVNTMMPIFAQDFSDHVSALVSYMTIYPVSTIVELSTGEIGIVAKTFSTDQKRPAVLPLLDQNKRRIVTTDPIFLADDENSEIKIVGVYTQELINKNTEIRPVFLPVKML